MKKYILVALGFAFVGMMLLMALAYQVLRNNPESTPPLTTEERTSSPVTPTISFGATVIQVELAKTSAEITRGLSGRPSLDWGHGMLFSMPETALHRFWMPDMHFSIDIVWLNDVFEVVDITYGATPESYPATFVPRIPARYVLEVPSGFAESVGIAIGVQGVFTVR
jgi:uncharacterized protein